VTYRLQKRKRKGTGKQTGERSLLLRQWGGGEGQGARVMNVGRLFRASILQKNKDVFLKQQITMFDVLLYSDEKRVD
jgi:hypothetical protein